MAQWMQEMRPEQPFHPLDLFNGDESYKPMWDQVYGVADGIREIAKAKGYTRYHVIGHSQGGLLVRTLAQEMDDHQIENLISLAGVQAGQYGALDHFPKPIHDLESREAWIILYNHLIQESFSAAGYWNDPFQQERYERDVVYLPVFDNSSSPANPKADVYKANFCRLGGFHVFGSPQDGVIQPWQSTQFGFWKDNTDDVMVPLRERDIYTKDSFGLKTLDESGRLHLVAPPDIVHADWIKNKAVFVQHILPLLT